jgi:superfamily II DNA helicase RecQ
MNYTDLKYWMDRMIYRTEWDRQHPLVRALFRGIGVHHAGMPSTYKDLVETLFRGKHIKIVVATNTLAMGINMPCRTAMFAGNDKLITPLLFRQMQGRAGRRGYDDVGHVVFFGFEPRTASRLLTSRLENLAGHYSISNTLVLRFLNLYHFSKDKGAVVKKFNNLLLRPYMAAGLSEAGKAAFTSQLQHHLRFAVEYCVQRGVADTAGAPVGLAQLVPHTHTHTHTHKRLNTHVQ